MGYNATVELNLYAKKITNMCNFIELLDEKEKNFISSQYADLFLEGEYYSLVDYFRKVTDEEKWLTILKKLAIHENHKQSIKFIGDEGTVYGYSATPDGKMFELVQELKEIEVKQ